VMVDAARREILALSILACLKSHFCFQIRLMNFNIRPSVTLVRSSKFAAQPLPFNNSSHWLMTIFYLINHLVQVQLDMRLPTGTHKGPRTAVKSNVPVFLNTDVLTGKMNIKIRPPLSQLNSAIKIFQYA